MVSDLTERFTSFAIRHNYSYWISGSEIHWFFIQGEEAFKKELYIPSILSFINGIEASLRVLVKYAREGINHDELDEAVLSNSLLRSAERVGLNIDVLALEGIDNFREKLSLKKPAVELVRLRNNLSHGNVFEFLESIPDTEYRIFTPEHLKPIALQVRVISEQWAKEIHRFKNEVLE